MTRRRFAVAIILTHLVAAALHGAAHGTLAVPAGKRGGALLIAAAVFVGPLVALVGLLGRRRLAGALVLSASMAVALVYGLAFHYVLRTPDHVAHAPPGMWGAVFRFSAAGIAVLEACGLAAGVLLTTSLLRRDVGARREPQRGGPRRSQPAG
jgi:hypothetical protein